VNKKGEFHMLLAEIHGKSLEQARESEDYLTSTVFGHLRYVPPGPFWDDLLNKARGLPSTDGREPSLGRVLADAGLAPSSYTSMSAHFWKYHPLHGEPDLLLSFTGPGRQPLTLLVEVKLWSGKSGAGADDQLVRYLRILEDLEAFGVPVSEPAGRRLIFLTPHESLAEIESSAAYFDDPVRDRDRLFRLQWQDVKAAAVRGAGGTDGLTHLILDNVAQFLSRMALEYFSGFRRLESLPRFTEDDGTFYRERNAAKPNYQFAGFIRFSELSPMAVKRGGWVL
jgi:hypothetical protein